MKSKEVLRKEYDEAERKVGEALRNGSQADIRRAQLNADNAFRRLQPIRGSQNESPYVRIETGIQQAQRDRTANWVTPDCIVCEEWNDIPIPPRKREVVKVWRWSDEQYHEVPARLNRDLGVEGQEGERDAPTNSFYARAIPRTSKAL